MPSRGQKAPRKQRFYRFIAKFDYLGNLISIDLCNKLIDVHDLVLLIVDMPYHSDKNGYVQNKQ